MAAMERCSRCGSLKDPQQFYLRTVNGKRYRRPECKDCSKELSRADQPRENERRQARTEENPEYAQKRLKQSTESNNRKAAKQRLEISEDFAEILKNPSGFRALFWLQLQYRSAKKRGRVPRYVAWKNRLKRARVDDGRCKCGEPIEARERCRGCLKKLRDMERESAKKSRGTNNAS